MSLTALLGGIAAGVHTCNHRVVAAGQPMVTLTRADLPDVVFSIPESPLTSLDIRNTVYCPAVRINTLPGCEFTAEYKEHTGSNDNSTFTWQIILIMPRPNDSPTVGGASGTMTVNLGNLPASAGWGTLVMPVEAMLNPDNQSKNEPVVQVVKGGNVHPYLEERRVMVGEVTSQGAMIAEGFCVGEQMVAAGVSKLHGR